MSTTDQHNVASRPPDLNLPCPECGPHCRDPANRKRKVLGAWKQKDGSEVKWCIRCGWAERTASTWQVRPAAPTYDLPEDNSLFAASLWARRQAIEGTPAETYLRVGRGIRCRLPATLCYLPGNGGHPHAMISAFGLCEEPEPGLLTPPENVSAIHLTKLTEDGLWRISKRMLGPVSGQPLVLAPPNDALGLIITEGIEDALSLQEATGLGAWAGGSAGHMAKLGSIVPDCIDCVTIAEDHNEAGRQATRMLYQTLRTRGINCHILKL